MSLEITDNIIDLNKVELRDLIPNPIIIKSKNNNEEISEYALKELILSDLDNFLLQLGYGFTIGILICKKENNYVIEYCSDDRIAVREYELV